MPNKFANIKAQDGLSRTQQKRLVKKAAKNAKYTNPLNAGPTRTTAMTPNQRRRDRELIFLNLRPAILPKGLFPRYSALLNRRIEMMTTDKARYEHDLARRNAIGRVMQERIKEGIDYKDDLANWQRVLQVEDLTAWREKKEEHTAWIIRKLEEKCSTKHNTGFVSTIEGRLAVYRDLLHVTLQLDNKGGIPEGAVPWLRSCFTSDASKRAGDDRAFASWALAVKQAVNYIAACRRKAGVVGVFEQTHRHRGHKIEVFASWSKEELEQEEWVCRDDGADDEEEDEEILEERKRAFQEKLGLGAKTEEKAQGEGNFDDEDGEEGGVSLRLMEAEGEYIAPEPVSAEESEGEDGEDWEDLE